MRDKITFDYFYGQEADMFSFYRIPKLLFTNDYFKVLSTEAKVLYGLMLDRMCLSVKNQWVDAENRTYIYFSLENVMEMLNCKKNKAIDVMKELDSNTGIGLIEKKRQGQGKPAIIYVKSFMTEKITADKRLGKSTSDVTEEGSEVGKINNMKLVKQTSAGLENKHLEVGKRDTNNTKGNHTDIIDSHLIISGSDVSGLEEYHNYSQLIRENISLDILCERYPYDKEMLDGIYDLILEIVLCKSGNVVIASNEYPIQLVKSKFLKLDSMHIEYVLDCLNHTTSKVRNIKKYMLAALFNAPTTIKGYYRAEVNHDMPELAQVKM